MPNLFLNLPAPSANGAGAAVDVSGTGQLKTLIVGSVGSAFDAQLTIEYATDAAGTNWAPIAGFGNPGHRTVEVAARWMRVVVSGYRSGNLNVDLGASLADGTFVQVTDGAPPVSIAGMPPFKTVVVDGGFSGAVNIEVSEDGTSWAQVMSFLKGGGQSATIIGQFVRATVSEGALPEIWMGSVANQDGSAPFANPPQFITIYARATGSDETGDGRSIATAYRTVQRAALDVPAPYIPDGVYYIINSTDLIVGGAEILPPNYALPAWKSSRAMQFLTFPEIRGAVTILAEPRDVPALGAEAIIAETDLEATAVGGEITDATNASPIVITTTTPHGLLVAPFGVDSEVLPVVEIANVNGNGAANGVWFAVVTSPTTFELYDLDLNPSIGSGGFLASPLSTTTVLYVQDPLSGQIEVKVSAVRNTWLANDLKGKLLIDGSGTKHVIYGNTGDTLQLAKTSGPSFDDGPARIAEQSCVLQCSDSLFNGFIGGFNVANQDSICFEGIEIRQAADESSFLQWSGTCLVNFCRIEHAVFDDAIRQSWAIDCYMTPFLAEYSQLYQSSCLIEGGEPGSSRAWFAFAGTVFMAPEVPLGLRTDGVVDWDYVKIISNADPVFFADTGNTFLTSVSIDGGAGDAVRIEGQGRCVLQAVGGSGWLGDALVVDNGAQVEVDALTFSDPDTMLVGLLNPRTFADFRTPAGTGYPRQQMDIQAFNATPADFGALGTASRVFQRDP